MLHSFAPLAFLDVDPKDYATAMLGFHEMLDVTVEVELFARSLCRSIRKYQGASKRWDRPTRSACGTGSFSAKPCRRS
jgi:hypothetical protein